eukprot:SAG11_NODE_22037_length_413_cov_1.143312_1_plen_26_part_10
MFLWKYLGKDLSYYIFIFKYRFLRER